MKNLAETASLLWPRMLLEPKMVLSAPNSFSDASEEEQDFLRQFSFICMLSFDVYLKKQMIERLIDQLPAPDFLKSCCLLRLFDITFVKTDNDRYILTLH